MTVLLCKSLNVLPEYVIHQSILVNDGQLGNLKKILRIVAKLCSEKMLLKFA